MSAATFVCPICQYTLPESVSVCPNCEEDLTALIHLRFRAQIAYNEGLRLAYAGKLENALVALQQAVHTDANNVEAWVVLGKLYAQQRQFAEARRMWQRTLELTPANLAAQAGLARLLELERDAQQGINVQRFRGISLVIGAFLTGALILLLAQQFIPEVNPPAYNPHTPIQTINTSTVLPTLIATFTPITPSPTSLPTPSPTPIADRQSTVTKIVCYSFCKIALLPLASHQFYRKIQTLSLSTIRWHWQAK